MQRTPQPRVIFRRVNAPSCLCPRFRLATWRSWGHHLREHSTRTRHFCKGRRHRRQCRRRRRTRRVQSIQSHRLRFRGRSVCQRPLRASARPQVNLRPSSRTRGA
eukprot:Amastigsp_a186474_2.p4 type:complete len:105 gc:universal Amastigsp_a186474_2:168-482(+)